MTADRYAIETYSSRADWLHARKSGIGASEWAAVLGYDGMKSSYTIATDKLTPAIDNSPPSEEAEWGLRDEAAIAQKFCEETGLTVTDPGNWTIFRSVERPWLFCTPDRLMLPMSALEIKETFGESGAQWTNGVPRKHRVQLQATIWILDVPMGYFAARINTGFGVTFRYHPMQRADKFIDWALPKLDAFWAAVQRGDMPDVDGSLATSRALSLRYDSPVDRNPPVDLPDDLEPLGKEYDGIVAAESKAKADKELIKNRVKAALGNHTVGVLPDLSGFKWAGANGSRRFTRLEKVRIE